MTMAVDGAPQCKFWATTNKRNGDLDYSRSDCRRHAPEARERSQRWPETDGNEWCGEFENIEKGENFNGK